MNIDEFILKIEEEFDDITPGTLKPESKFRAAVEWNSVNALIFIALISNEYDVVINGLDIEKALTVQDLFEIVKKRVA
jgi:acyl carrier protein